MTGRDDRDGRWTTMYHGTTGYAARTILTQGLLADPPDRHYDEESDPDLASLAGSYHSNRLETALRYAIRFATESACEPAIVVSTIDTADAVPDEDLLTAALHHAEQATRMPDALVAHAHRHLAGRSAASAEQRELILGYLAARRRHEERYDDASQRERRDALDALTRAYRSICGRANPHYLGGHEGHHTLRVPSDIAPERIVSITSVILDARGDEPAIAAIEAIKGRAIPRRDLEMALEYGLAAHFYD